MCQCEGGNREGGEKKRATGRREVERLKGERTGIGGDQRRCWTVERICVTAISKTITPAAPTRGTGNLLLWTDLIGCSRSQRAPLCRPGWADGQTPHSRAPGTQPPARRHQLSPANGRQGSRLSPSLWHSKDFCGKV